MHCLYSDEIFLGPNMGHETAGNGQTGPFWALGRNKRAPQVKVCDNHESNPDGPIDSSLDQIRSPGAVRAHRGPLKGRPGAKMDPFGAPGIP